MISESPLTTLDNIKIAGYYNTSVWQGICDTATNT